MALTLSQLYQFAVSNPTAKPLVAAAIAVTSQQIVLEDPATTNHAQRLAWAQKALLDPVSMATIMVWGILADPNVIAAMPSPSDAVIQTAVNAAVNNFLNA